MNDFGMFYPRGYLVVAFGRREDAERAQHDLLTGGYDPKDCQLTSSTEVAEGAERNLQGHTGFFSQLGWSDEALRKHLEAARQGDTFLLIYAPTDLEAERAMNVVRRARFDFAHRYHRFAIEVLQ